MLKTVFENRKDLVIAVAEFVRQQQQYLGAPSFSYRVGDFVIARDGSITSDSEMGDLKEFLSQKGFIQQEIENLEESVPEKEPNQQKDTDCIEFNIPLNDANKTAVVNFINMLYSKQYLINRALEMPILDIPEEFINEIANKGISEMVFDKISGFRIEGAGFVFTYPNIDGGEKLKAYITMICMTFAKAKECQRVRAKLIKPENEKYYMRTWLIRIGLGGKGGAETRKVLLQNLKGHSAFRTEAEIERAKEKYRQKKGL